VRIDAGNQDFVQIANVGGLTLSCGPGGFPADSYGLQFTATPPGGSGVTSVWKDDSIAGSSFNNLSGIAVITYLNPGTGTRHVVLRASNTTKSGTWDIFIEGSAANGCLASIQHTS
jgi:hypothetical protein